jgi:phage terminase large subunit GpA-like protein
VGVDAAKDLLLGQLAIQQPGPGYVHFSDELPREFYEQLTAEQRVLARVNGRESYRWIKRRPRNEQLDNRNYAMHAAMGLGLHKYTDAQWARLEAAVQPPADLFSAPAAVAPAPVLPPTTTPPTAPAPALRPARNHFFASDEWSSRL